MTPFVLVVLAVAVFYVFVKIRKASRSPRTSPSAAHSASQARRTAAGLSPADVFNANSEWLEARWKEAIRERESGSFSLVPKWFFDDATDRQLERIRNLGLRFSVKRMTKGQASDIIGVFEPVEEEHHEILRFFKVPTKGFNASLARHEVAKLFTDPKKSRAWQNRPSTALQKEFYHFFDIKIPAGLTYSAAEKTIAEKQEVLDNEESPLLNEWESLESIWVQLLDPETREGYEIKKPGPAVIKAAIETLRAEGNSLSKLEEDLQLVTDKIILLKPELQREI